MKSYLVAIYDYNNNKVFEDSVMAYDEDQAREFIWDVFINKCYSEIVKK